MSKFKSRKWVKEAHSLNATICIMKLKTKITHVSKKCHHHCQIQELRLQVVKEWENWLTSWKLKRFMKLWKFWASLKGYNSSNNHDLWVIIPLVLTFPRLNSIFIWEIYQSEEFLLKHLHNHRQIHTNPITKGRFKELQSGEASFILNMAQKMDIAAILASLRYLGRLWQYFGAWYCMPWTSQGVKVKGKLHRSNCLVLKRSHNVFWRKLRRPRNIWWASQFRGGLWVWNTERGHGRQNNS
jgi:hypothetical protein